MTKTVSGSTTEQPGLAIAKASEALARFSIADETFMPATLLLARATAGFTVDPLPLLREWDTRRTSEGGSVRYRWPFTHKSLRLYGHWTGLTGELSAWLSSATRPFAARFHWPEVALANRNRRTGLPSYDYYADLARLFQELPGLADADVEVAFLDMAHFGQVNNRLGMAVGDACLREFAQALTRIPDSMAIRDGGDEFLVVGAPIGPTTASGASLADRLDDFRQSWPATFRAVFGDEPVPAARILVARTKGRSLVEIRDELGRRIATLKERYPDPPETGVLVRVDDV